MKDDRINRETGGVTPENNSPTARPTPQSGTARRPDAGVDRTVRRVPGAGDGSMMRRDPAAPAARSDRTLSRAHRTPEEIAKGRPAPTRNSGSVPTEGKSAVRSAGAPGAPSANRARTMPRTGTGQLSRARSVPPKQTARRKKKRGKKSRVPTVILTVAVAAAIAVGVALILIGRAKKIENTVAQLIAENNYSEAYRTAEINNSRALCDYVSEEATKYYIAQGEFKNAYVFARLSGGEDAVTDAAIAEIVKIGKDSVYTEPFSVAMLSSDAAKFNDVLKEFIGEFTAERNYFLALDASALAIGDDVADKFASSVFGEGLSYYTLNMEDDEDLFRLISVYCSPDGSDTVDESSVSSIVDKFVEEGKKSEAFIIADHFGIDSSKIEVVPSDPSVSKLIHTVYPILTEEQKRAYHSTPLGYYKETFYINGGVVSGSSITDAVSVCTHEFTTVVMRSDGSVVSVGINGRSPEVPIPADVRGVQAVCGLRHAVILKADGTCEAFGSNEFGQCDVGEWRDVIAVAAGRYFTLGLRSDGTCVSCGSDRSGQCAVSDFRNVIGIGACDQTSVAVFSDGTAAIAGYRSMGLEGVYDLAGVEDVVCGGTFIVARLEDGSYTIVDGTVQGSAGDAEVLSGCRALSAGPASIAYIDSDGNLKYTGSGSPADNRLNNG